MASVIKRAVLSTATGCARAGGLGIVERDSGFFFRPDAHDAEAKTVLGKKLPAGRGIEDGRDVLALVAQHPATARHLTTKLAVRFVADEPPPALIDRLAQTYQTSGGDLRAVTRALAYSPEFWSRDSADEQDQVAVRGRGVGGARAGRRRHHRRDSRR